MCAFTLCSRITPISSFDYLQISLLLVLSYKSFIKARRRVLIYIIQTNSTCCHQIPSLKNVCTVQKIALKQNKSTLAPKSKPELSRNTRVTPFAQKNAD